MLSTISFGVNFSLMSFLRRIFPFYPNDTFTLHGITNSKYPKTEKKPGWIDRSLQKSKPHTFHSVSSPNLWGLWQASQKIFQLISKSKDALKKRAKMLSKPNSSRHHPSWTFAHSLESQIITQPRHLPSKKIVIYGDWDLENQLLTRFDTFPIGEEVFFFIFLC